MHAAPRTQLEISKLLRSTYFCRTGECTVATAQVCVCAVVWLVNAAIQYDFLMFTNTLSWNIIGKFSVHKTFFSGETSDHSKEEGPASYVPSRFQWTPQQKSWVCFHLRTISYPTNEGNALELKEFCLVFQNDSKRAQIPSSAVKILVFEWNPDQEPQRRRKGGRSTSCTRIQMGGTEKRPWRNRRGERRVSRQAQPLGEVAEQERRSGCGRGGRSLPPGPDHSPR